MHYKNLFLICLAYLIIPVLALRAEYNSVDTKKAYIRAGPGKWYPIKWVIKEKGLPVKVLKENGGDKNILLHDGTKGWISSNLLSTKRTVIVIENDYLLNNSRKPIASVMKNVVLDYLGCNKKKGLDLCKVKINKTKGYFKKNYLWGIN